MENKRSIGDMKKYLRWKKKKFLKIFGLSALLVLVLLVLVFKAPLPFPNQPNDVAAQADRYFAGCALKESDCTTTACSFYNSCDGQQPVCRIYDCGNEYGVFWQTPEGEKKGKRELKPDLGAVAKAQQDCSGSLEVLEQGCIEGSYEAKVMLMTKGKCEIGNFLVTLEELGNIPSTFRQESDGTYIVAADRCGKVTRIVPVAKDGLMAEMSGSYLSN
jgi:hypothetical protein